MSATRANICSAEKRTWRWVEKDGMAPVLWHGSPLSGKYMLQAAAPLCGVDGALLYQAMRRASNTITIAPIAAVTISDTKAFLMPRLMPSARNR